MTLIPGAVLIYERSNDVVYARYRDPPHNTIPRWEIGRTSSMTVLNNTELRQMIELAQTNAAFGELFESMLTMYYLLKEKS
jgi:hypothetical protein